MPLIENQTPIREAAKAIGKSRGYVRELIDAGKVTAIQTGGGIDSPWLAVDVEKLKAAHSEHRRYVPRPVKKIARRGLDEAPTAEDVLRTLHQLATDTDAAYAKLSRFPDPSLDLLKWKLLTGSKRLKRFLRAEVRLTKIFSTPYRMEEENV